VATSGKLESALGEIEADGVASVSVASGRFSLGGFGVGVVVTIVLGVGVGEGVGVVVRAGSGDGVMEASGVRVE